MIMDRFTQGDSISEGRVEVAVVFVNWSRDGDVGTPQRLDQESYCKEKEFSHGRGMRKGWRLKDTGSYRIGASSRLSTTVLLALVAVSLIVEGKHVVRGEFATKVLMAVSGQHPCQID